MGPIAKAVPLPLLLEIFHTEREIFSVPSDPKDRFILRIKHREIQNNNFIFKLRPEQPLADKKNLILEKVMDLIKKSLLYCGWVGLGLRKPSVPYSK